MTKIFQLVETSSCTFTCLFIFTFEKIMREIVKQNFKGIPVGTKNITYLAYADHIELISHTR